MAISMVSTPDIALAWEFYHAHRMTEESNHSLILKEVSLDTIEWWLTGAGRYTFAMMENDRMVGLISGVYLQDAKTGYLSYLMVTPTHRGQGVATKLLAALEKAFEDIADCEKIDVLFRNPVQLPWYVCEDGGDHHPCVPGVDVSSKLYAFLCKHGYNNFVTQNAYYRRLAGYQDPSDIAVKRAALLQSGIEVTLYDPDHHVGLSELFDNIKNPGWKVQVMANTHRPIVVAVDHNTRQEGKSLVVAYTGPLTQHEGRGVFCGIGTRTEYRGRGIGKVVFCEMCRRHLDTGATFMSLYTGDTNPARNIYEAAGFAIVRSFGDMRKMLVK